MYKLFKGTRILAPIIAWIPTIVFLVTIVYPRFIENQDWSLVTAVFTFIALIFFIAYRALFFLIWMYIVFVAFNILAKYKTMRMKNILLDECDPAACADAFEQVLGRLDMIIARKKNKRVQNYEIIRTDILLEVFFCYYDNNDLNSAKLALDGVKCFSEQKKLRIYEQFQYHHCSFAYYLDTKDYSNAKVHLEKMDELRSGEKLSKVISGVFRDAFFTNTYCYNIYALEKFDGAELFLKYQYDKSSKKYFRIKTQNLLGKMYMNEKRLIEAKAAFEYIIANGNMLSCVEAAKLSVALCQENNASDVSLPEETEVIA